MTLAEFASRLRELRSESNLSQQELANQLGLARTTIANYEQSTRFPDQYTLCNMADYFGISLDYLLGRIDEKWICYSKNVVVDRETALTVLTERYLLTILQGDRKKGFRMILEAVQSGVDLRDIYCQVLEPSLKEIGRLWETLRVSVAQEHYFTASTKVIMSQVYSFAHKAKPKQYHIVGACIHNELHDVGLGMVLDFFEMDGWRSYYLGAHTPTESIVNMLKETRADLLAISVTMMEHVESVYKLIQEVRSSPACQNTKILVGGYVFNRDPELWIKVGADGYATDAREAVLIGNQLVLNPEEVASGN